MKSEQCISPNRVPIVGVFVLRKDNDDKRKNKFCAKATQKTTITCEETGTRSEGDNYELECRILPLEQPLKNRVALDYFHDWQEKQLAIRQDLWFAHRDGRVKTISLLKTAAESMADTVASAAFESV